MQKSPKLVWVKQGNEGCLRPAAAMVVKDPRERLGSLLRERQTPYIRHQSACGVKFLPDSKMWQLVWLWAERQDPQTSFSPHRSTSTPQSFSDPTLAMPSMRERTQPFLIRRLVCKPLDPRGRSEGKEIGKINIPVSKNRALHNQKLRLWGVSKYVFFWCFNFIFLKTQNHKTGSMPRLNKIY